MASAPEAEMHSSPLVDKLPAEIRLQIFRFVLHAECRLGQFDPISKTLVKGQPIR